MYVCTYVCVQINHLIFLKHFILIVNNFPQYFSYRYLVLTTPSLCPYLSHKKNMFFFPFALLSINQSENPVARAALDLIWHLWVQLSNFTALLHAPPSNASSIYICIYVYVCTSLCTAGNDTFFIVDHQR